MKNLFLVLFTLSLTLSYAQPPLTADSVYWGTKYCDTAQTYEEYLTQWTWNGNVGDCIQPPQGMVDAFYNEENSTISLMLLDSYECCCQQASLPGSENVLTFFIGSPCQTYLDSIGFIYNDPEYINWTSLSENDIKLNEIYIDIYGRQYITPPKGLSIMNRKKYYRL